MLFLIEKGVFSVPNIALYPYEISKSYSQMFILLNYLIEVETCTENLHWLTEISLYTIKQF